MEHRLKHPFTEEQVRQLKIDDIVYLDGEIAFSAGLPTFQRIAAYVEKGAHLPIDLKNAALFHLGSDSREINGHNELTFVNPTTSARFNPYMPELVKKLQLRLIGGKGGLDQNSVNALQEVGCVYLSFLGGGVPIYTQAIKEVLSISWNDLVPHYRLRRVRVAQLGPLVVAIDAHGNSIYKQIECNLETKFPELIKEFEHF